jgi:Tol biopolymer transport system component
VYTWGLLNVNLWRLDTRTGERRMLIGSTYDSGIPQYSPDGRKIAFQSNRSGNHEVWTCEADGSNCLQLTSFGGPQCGTPRWSPDGRWLALDSRVEGQSEIYVIAADGGTPRRVTNGTGFRNAIPTWSADGRWLYFTSNRTGRLEIWKIPVDGGQMVQVTRAGGRAPLISPDGRFIYYVKQPGQPGVFRMPVEGGEEQQVLAQATYWSNFGVAATGVYFSPDRSRLQFLDAATGKVSTLTVLDNIAEGLCVSPDGRYVVWAQQDRNTTDLMLVEHFR